eukprot:Hpha_TRINITY_DN15622_c0_g1::TRINITY_DN15622_c0_g1_i3::g.98561::m.98561
MSYPADLPTPPTTHPASPQRQRDGGAYGAVGGVPPSTADLPPPPDTHPASPQRQRDGGSYVPPGAPPGGASYGAGGASYGAGGGQYAPGPAPPPPGGPSDESPKRVRAFGTYNTTGSPQREQYASAGQSAPLYSAPPAGYTPETGGYVAEFNAPPAAGPSDESPRRVHAFGSYSPGGSPQRQAGYQPAPQASYQPAPQASYQPAPQASYQSAPQASASYGAGSPPAGGYVADPLPPPRDGPSDESPQRLRAFGTYTHQ